MKPVLIFRHIDFEGPGYLGEFLDRNAIPWEVIAVDEGEKIPPNPDAASGLVFMGGPMSVNDNLPWIDEEVRLIRQAHVHGVPLLGHCLGGQLISRALGARVHANPVREIGWHPVEVMNTVQAGQWFAGLPSQIMVYHWHGETFDLPEGAVPLLTSRYCQNQGYVCGKTLALQCHIEMQKDMIPVWTDKYRDEIPESTDSVQTAAEMQTELDDRITGLHRVADTVYTHWLENLNPEHHKNMNPDKSIP